MPNLYHTDEYLRLWQGIDHVATGGNMQVHIVRGKGKKDRYVHLPESILEQLRTYFKAYRPKELLFDGQQGGPYSTRSAQKVFYDSLGRAGVNKKVGIHGLRHSYATHLFEAGTDIAYPEATWAITTSRPPCSTRRSPTRP